jgi:hypothetical protein
MNPEIKQQIENLMGGSTLLPASSGATSGSKFDPMRVPSWELAAIMGKDGSLLDAPAGNQRDRLFASQAYKRLGRSAILQKFR